MATNKKRQQNPAKKKKHKIRNILLNNIFTFIIFIAFWAYFFWMKEINHTMQNTKPITYEYLDKRIGKSKNSRSSISIIYNGEKYDVSVIRQEAINAENKLPDVYYSKRFDLCFTKAYEEEPQSVIPITLVCFFIFFLGIQFIPSNSKTKNRAKR